MPPNLRRLAALLIGLGTAATVTACGSAGATGTTADSERLEVVAAAYPFQFVAERVAGPYAAVTNLTSPGAEPHDVELTPPQVASLAEVDLVVYQRGFQAAVDEGVEQSGTGHALDTARVAPPEPLATEHEHEQEHEGEDAAEAGHEHGEDGLDPHVWLDPDKLTAITNEVANRLAGADPGHENEYRANAAALAADLDRLDEELRTGLADCERDTIVTTHAAFGYLTRRYGLEQVAINGINPDSEPSAAQVAAVQQEAREHGVTTIFTETQASPAVATAVAGDLGLRTDVLDPLEVLGDQSRGADFLAVMRANLTALRSANGCR